MMVVYTLYIVVRHIHGREFKIFINKFVCCKNIRHILIIYWGDVIYVFEFLESDKMLEDVMEVIKNL